MGLQSKGLTVEPAIWSGKQHGFLTMTVDVYQTNKKGTYLFLPPGEPFSSVPQPVRDSVGLLQFFNTVELAPGMLGAEHSEIHADFEKQGYSIHEAVFKITEHE